MFAWPSFANMHSIANNALRNRVTLAGPSVNVLVVREQGALATQFRHRHCLPCSIAGTSLRLFAAYTSELQENQRAARASRTDV